ncbi:MAG: hypothetical protein RH917_08035 [Lacipirellulaceae bacterium]
MTTVDGKPLPAIGFLTAVESPQHGLFGGYLVLSLQGRPLEFRCTTPVKPTRAQEILYGKTLRPYLLCELLGHPLISQAQLRPELVVTNQNEMLGLSLLCDLPVGVVSPIDGEAASDADRFIEKTGDLSLSRQPSLTSINTWGNCQVQFPEETQLEPNIRELLDRLSSYVELNEPFSRIEAALAEAQQAAEEEVDDNETHRNQAAA